MPLLLALVLFSGCYQVTKRPVDCPAEVYFMEATMRCHSASTGDFVKTACCED